MQHRIRVLHVEDDESDSVLLQRALRQGGLDWDVTRIETRDALIAALESGDVALIVCDNTLPTITGFEALREAQARRPDVPFVFYTGTLGEERAVEAVKAGAADVILKGAPDRLVPALLRAQRETKEREGRRRAESDLRESERRYRELFQHNPVPTWILEPQTHRFLAVNDAAVARYGYSRDEFLAMTAMDIRPQEDVERYRSASSTSGLRFAGHWRHRTKDGRILWVDIAAHDIVLEGQACTLVAANDISEVFEANERLECVTRHQAVLAQLSQFALANGDIDTVMQRAADELASALDVELTAVTELMSDGEALLLRAGHGWQEGSLGHLSFPVRPTAYRQILDTSTPVRFEDLPHDRRFEPHPAVLAHGVTSGISVTIGGVQRPFGRLGALATRHRLFTDGDLRFLEAAAAILATAI